MAIPGVLIDSGPLSAMQRLDAVPPERWRELVSVRREFCAVRLPHDCRQLLHFVDEAPEMLEALGYADSEDFLRRGLELDPDMVGWALQGLRRLKPDEPIPFQRAIELGRRGAPKGNRNAAKGDRDGQNKGVPNTFVRGSTNAAYLLARLDRDYPDLAAQVRAGTLKANTAAKAAGIIRERTPLEQMEGLWAKLTHDDRLTFLRWARTP